MQIRERHSSSVILYPNEQQALDRLNGEETPRRLPDTRYFEACMGDTINPFLAEGDVMATKWLSTCAGFGFKLVDKTKPKNEGDFALAHISEEPAENLAAIFRNFKDAGVAIEIVTISAQVENMPDILTAISMERIRNLGLKPRIALIDTRTVGQVGGLLITTEGGILLKGVLNQDKRDKFETGEESFDYHAVKRWHW